MKSQLSIFRDIMRKVKGYFLIELNVITQKCDNLMLMRNPEIDSLVF